MIKHFDQMKFKVLSMFNVHPTLIENLPKTKTGILIRLTEKAGECFKQWTVSVMYFKFPAVYIPTKKIDE